MKHIQKTLKTRWITEPMNYDLPKRSRNTHHYMEMYHNQLKTNKGLLIALGMTILVSFGYGVGAYIHSQKLTSQIASYKRLSEIGAEMSAQYADREDKLVNIIQNPNKPQNPEQIIEYVFGKDAPLMKKVAYCESHLNPKAANKQSSARGLFQIMASVHQVKESWLYSPMINSLIAKELYDKQGTTPWNSSKSCWSK